MPKRTGITIHRDEKRRALLEELRNVRALRWVGPFGSRREAMHWEGDHGPEWEHDEPELPRASPRSQWWGYELEHDGPSTTALRRAVDEVVKKWS